MRSEERIAKMKRLFLQTLQDNGGHVAEACRVVGRSRTAIASWRDEDDEFAAAWEAVQALNIEALEAEVDRRAMGYEEPIVYKGELTGESVTRYSDNLLMFRLKALAPEKYRDGPGARKGSDLSDAELDAAITRMIAKRTAKGQSPAEEATEAVN